MTKQQLLSYVKLAIEAAVPNDWQGTDVVTVEMRFLPHGDGQNSLGEIDLDWIRVTSPREPADAKDIAQAIRLRRNAMTNLQDSGWDDFADAPVHADNTESVR